MKPFSAAELKKIDSFLHLNEFGDSEEIIEIHKSGEKSKRDMNERKSANTRRRRHVDSNLKWRDANKRKYRRYMKGYMRQVRAVKREIESSPAKDSQPSNHLTKSPSIRHSSASSSSVLTRKP